jgi:hypothetical protein
MNKINTTTILEKYKMLPKHNARMNIPLYRMISMHVIHPTLKIDVLKMEHAFHFGYHEVFYVSPLNSKERRSLLMIMRPVGITTSI